MHHRVMIQCNRCSRALRAVAWSASRCQELTTLWVVRLDDGAELKVTDPKEQQGDVEEKEAKGEERRDGVNGG